MPRCPAAAEQLNATEAELRRLCLLALSSLSVQPQSIASLFALAPSLGSSGGAVPSQLSNPPDHALWRWLDNLFLTACQHKQVRAILHNDRLALHMLGSSYELDRHHMSLIGIISSLIGMQHLPCHQLAIRKTSIEHTCIVDKQEYLRSIASKQSGNAATASQPSAGHLLLWFQGSLAPRNTEIYLQLKAQYIRLVPEPMLAALVASKSGQIWQAMREVLSSLGPEMYWSQRRLLLVIRTMELQTAWLDSICRVGSAWLLW